MTNNTPVVVVIASTPPGLSLWSFCGGFGTAQYGFSTTIQDPELTALSTVLHNIPFKPFMSALFGRDNHERRLPITVLTASQQMIDRATGLAALDETLINSAPLYRHLATKLQAFDITWELLEPTAREITDLQEWAGLVQG
jgi:hypothetical protein